MLDGTSPVDLTLPEDQDGPLVRHTPYHGIDLTERGMAVALEMLRRHRLIELFLHELLVYQPTHILSGHGVAGIPGMN